MKHVFEPVRRLESGAIDQRFYQQRAAQARGDMVCSFFQNRCERLISWFEAIRRYVTNR